MKNNKIVTRLRIACWFICIAMVCCVLFTPFGFADTTPADKEKLDDINDQLSDAQKELNEGKTKANALSSEIKSLEKQIYSSEVELNSLQKNINSTKTLINEAIANLSELEGNIAKQGDDLNDRLRAMYKNGDVGMIAVLLGSADVTDFMTNMDMVKRIYESDAELLASLQTQYKDVIDQKMALNALKEQLIAQQEEEAAQIESLESNKSIVQSKKAEVDKDNKVLAQQVDALNAEANALTAKILGLQGTASYVGGIMVWPSQASTRISSPFGNRLHPILKVYKLHTGIDIAAASGTNILAANSGTVITAGWNNSYGYMVMIDHGGGIVTLYAHSSKLLVKKGDIVARGQTIAKVGSTGMSTGPHLHFEVRVNGAYKNPLDYVTR